jgi:hypothetical protein
VADPFEHAIVRLVPDVAREELINVGAIVYCPAREWLEARIAFDEARAVALFPGIDVATVRMHLAAIPRACNGEGPFADLDRRERFRFLVAPKNTIIQTTCAHGGVTADPSAALERIMETLVRPRV